jgi:hypothetical protein
MGIKIIRTKKSKRIPVELISLHTHLEINLTRKVNVKIAK